MKKFNKKGFTLAELLIVIAIIAILIAIAIPAFSASLQAANLATDHSNIRSAYAVYRTAEMLGTIDIDEDTTDTPDGSADVDYYFNSDGTIAKDSNTNAYKCKATPKNPTECDASVGCKAADSNHEKDAIINIHYDHSTKEWSFKVSKD